jgi:hypothetical protein
MGASLAEQMFGHNSLYFTLSHDSDLLPLSFNNCCIKKLISSALPSLGFCNRSFSGFRAAKRLRWRSDHFTLGWVAAIVPSGKKTKRPRRY